MTERHDNKVHALIHGSSHVQMVTNVVVHTQNFMLTY